MGGRDSTPGHSPRNPQVCRLQSGHGQVTRPASACLCSPDGEYDTGIMKVAARGRATGVSASFLAMALDTRGQFRGKCVHHPECRYLVFEFSMTSYR